MLNTLTVVFFKEQSCTYLVKILTLAPTAEFCAGTMYDSTIFGILELGLILQINTLFLCICDL